MKNLVLASPDKRILFLSPTYEGSHSEKRMADLEAFDFARGRVEVLELLMDLGFPGYEAAGAVVVRPQRKPRGGALTPEQKAENRAKASQRVVVEHALSGVKIWRVVKEVFRSWLDGLRDRVMVLACGLHNFRLRCRARPIHT